MESTDIIQSMMLVSPNRKMQIVNTGKVLLVPAKILTNAENAPTPSRITPYFTTKDAKTYHKEGCFTIRNAKSLIEVSLEEAEKQGKTPCKRCED